MEEKFEQMCDKLVAVLNPGAIERDRLSREGFSCKFCGGGHGELCGNPPVEAPCGSGESLLSKLAENIVEFECLQKLLNKEPVVKFFKFLREWD